MAIIIVDPSTIQDTAEKTAAEAVLDGIRYRLGTSLTSEDLPNNLLLNDIYIGSSERTVLSLYNESKQDPPGNFQNVPEAERQNYKITTNVNFKLLPNTLKEKLILAVQYKVLLELLYSFKDVRQIDYWRYRATFFDQDLDKKEAEFLNRYNGVLAELVPGTTSQSGRPPTPVVSTKQLGF